MSKEVLVKVIPNESCFGRDFDFWHKILFEMIDQMKFKTRCSSEDLNFIFNNRAFEEIFYRFKNDCKLLYKGSISYEYDPITNEKKGEICGIKFIIEPYYFCDCKKDDAFIKLVCTAPHLIYTTSRNSCSDVRTFDVWAHMRDGQFCRCGFVNDDILDSSSIIGTKQALNSIYGCNKDTVDSQAYRTKKILNAIYGVKKENKDMYAEIKKVIFNDPATIVFWKDGTKTIVKCMPGEKFDPEKGILVAIYKKNLKDKPNYFKEIKKWADTYNAIIPYEVK